MAIKLLFTVMDSHLYKSKPRLKIMLMSLCNFSNEFGEGKMWNGTMARHIGTGEEQVRRYKRELEADGICKFNYKRGKGRFTSFKIDLLALEMAVNLTDEKGKMTPNVTPPVGGVTGEVTPPVREVTPPVAPKTPTSRSGVKRERTIKGGLRSATSRIVDVEPLARHWRKTLIAAHGEAWLQSWLVGEQIIQTPDGVVLLVKSAFGKASVERALETLTGGDTVQVMVNPQSENAHA